MPLSPAPSTVRALRDLSGAQACGFIGLAHHGDEVCITDSCVDAPAEWGLQWSALDGHKASDLLDLPMLWANLDSQQLQPVPLDAFAHGIGLLPPSATHAPGHLLGCVCHTDRTFLGFLLFWPFYRSDRQTLAQFRVEAEALEQVQRWGHALAQRSVGQGSYTAMLDAHTGHPVEGLSQDDHPLHHRSVRDRTTHALNALGDHGSHTTSTAHGWHLRLRRMSPTRVALRMVPLRPLDLPITHILAPQQRRVAALAAAGHTANEMAEALQVAPQTVRSHLKRVYQLLDASNRVELANRLRACPFQRDLSS